MINKTFPLTKNLVLPISGNDLTNGAYLFVKEEFGLSYENFRPVPEKKILYLDLVVRRVDTDATIHNVKQFVVTEQGTQTSTVINAEEYNKCQEDFNKALADKEAAVVNLNEKSAVVSELQQELLVASEEDKPAIQEQLNQAFREKNEAYTTLSRAQQALEAIPVVIPEYEYILPYTEVISWFNNEGIILEESLDDAMNIPFGNGVIGDYLK